jgi:peptidoglycan/xylan/chitin deacetylase (PgdA/CDA1 family)
MNRNINNNTKAQNVIKKMYSSGHQVRGNQESTELGIFKFVMEDTVFWRKNKQLPKLTRQIASHTWSHANLNRISRDRIVKEMIDVEDALMRIIGVKWVK